MTTLNSRLRNSLPATPTGRTAGWSCLLAAVLIVISLGGCAAFHPVRGVPAPYVPPEFLGPSRSGKKTIDLSLLVQTQPDEYRVAAKDVLSIYIPGVLGSLNVDDERQIGETPPINSPSNPEDPPTIGYPVTVRGNGTIALPYIPPINVHGMTLPEIEYAIRRAYTEHSRVLNGEQDRVLVSLQRRREYRVLVVRQETSSELTQGGQPGTLNIGNSKRGTAKTVRLPAYENDVLHALASSEQGADGLPGLDAKNTIYIIRRKKAPPAATSNGRLPTDFDAGARPSTSPRFVPDPVPPASIPPQPAQEIPLQTIPLRPQSTEAISDAVGVVPEIPSQPSHEPAVPQTPLPTVPAPAPTRTIAPVPDRAPTPQSGPEAGPSTPDDEWAHPVWPGPANPPASIQRTSDQRGAVQMPATWPTVRGQSPQRSWSWGHSRSISANPTSGHSTSMSSYFRGSGASVAGAEPWGAAGLPMPTNQPAPIQFLAPDNQGTSNAHHWQNGGQRSGGAATVSAHSTFASTRGDFSGIGGHDDSWQGALTNFDPTVDNPNVIKIPIRLAEGEYPTFTERDIILNDGDIVFIESRETEVFYTGGLLGGGQYTLPRDYDLRVLEAISIAQSQNNVGSGRGRSIGGVSALNQDVTISASHIVILRSLPNGTRIPIEVDLYKAVRRPQENILIQPGDLVILQYTKVEAVAAFFERHLLEGAMFGVAAAYLNSGSNN